MTSFSVPCKDQYLAFLFRNLPTIK